MVLGCGHWFRSDSLRQPMEHPTPCLPSRGWEHLRRRAGRSRPGRDAADCSRRALAEHRMCVPRRQRSCRARPLGRRPVDLCALNTASRARRSSVEQPVDLLVGQIRLLRVVPVPAHLVDGHAEHRGREGVDVSRGSCAPDANAAPRPRTRARGRGRIGRDRWPARSEWPLRESRRNCGPCQGRWWGSGRHREPWPCRAA